MPSWKSAVSRFSPALRRVEWLWRRENELLAEVAGPAEGDEGALPLEPCFELAAFAAADSAGPTEPSLWMPSAVMGIAHLAPATARMWCHLRLEQSYGAARAAVRLHSSEGALVAAIDAIELQRFDAAQGGSQMLHTVVWQPAARPDDAPALPAANPADARWLILADASGVGEALALQLAAGGVPAVITGAGAHYQSLPDQRYVVNPAARADFDSLLRDACGEGAPAGIVYLWALDAPTGAAGDTFLQTQERVGGGLLNLTHALLARGGACPISIVTQGAQHTPGHEGVQHIAQSPLWGLGRALAEEMPDFGARLIDLDPADTPADAATRLARELVAANEDQLLLRGDARLAARLVRVPAQDTAPSRQPLRLRADRGYLLTGGFGTLGAQVARWMVAQGARRLILMGRTPLPPRAGWAALDGENAAAGRVALVRELEQLGATVHTPAVDVADAAALRSWLDGYRAEGWPPIGGVIHMAATFDGLLLHELEPQDYTALLRTKVVGALLLSELLPDVDFFVLFSSIAALLPQSGQGAYAAANATLDALANRRASLGKHALSVNWGVWAAEQRGSSEAYRQRTDLADHLLAARGFDAFRVADGLDALARLLQSTHNQAMVAHASTGQH